ncbi:L,D-transpeptidase family protein [Chelativorans sp. Marseille-P2723]|uniref:L,D-transpeptidase family protein n=1 Tax=Chelativorans sp. Marseille-P2723 TaxID=2709133 RepID=UPI001FEE8B2C|nr:L,D-transpeptidase family protein [Chelativorans sp. Marseille-P2723]
MEKRHADGCAISVRQRPGKPTQGFLRIGGLTVPCSLGRSGITALKREGDGATPLATLRPLGVLFRRDRRRNGIGPVRLPSLPVLPGFGWCDAPEDPNYNRPVPLPFRASHEKMRRSDRLYDVCIVLDWNTLPRRRYRGSAIFLHIAHEGLQPTEGCIAVCPRVMARILPLLTRRTRFVVMR